jgi:flagella basal body P-ring formation protein FlgA
VVITEAPPPGGSRIIHHEMIRAALTAKGVNLAKFTLSGAAQCEVRRPATPQPAGLAQANSTVDHPDGAGRSALESKSTKPGSDVPGQTLRQAIEEHFQKAMSRYGGRVEVLFDSHDLQALELTGPALQFQIHVEKPSLLGLCAVEVEVFKENKSMQRIPLVVRTALSRSVVTARRAINQGATLVTADVELMPVSFTHLDDLGVDDTALVLGQRAKRFIPSGTAIDLESLEAVPLVLRGQLITLVSEIGGVRVVTTAKAGANGKRGETIRVRSMDDNKFEMDAVVTGPGEARAVGSSGAAEDSKPRLVLGGGHER